jgi:DNA (cytosine-5)-methyltransferase 1
MDKKVGIFSFFSGAGFLDLGFELTNLYEILFVNEYHKPFMEIYLGAREKMMIGKPIYGCETEDITSYNTPSKIKWFKSKIFEAKQIHELVGFIGGPPCPDFSIGGKNKGKEGENGKLSGTYIELICKVKPDFFVFENVKGLYRTAKHRQFFDLLKSRLKKHGYVLTEKLINAIEFGAPQDRERIILIGFKKVIIKNAKIKVSKDATIPGFNWDSNVRYNAKDILSLPWLTTNPFQKNSKMPLPIDIPIELTVEYWFNKNDVTNHPNRDNHFTPRAGLKRFKLIDEGDDSKKSYKRLHRWRYSPTAAYGNNEVHLHPYKERRISAAEALAIQSLPKEFIIPSTISLSNMFKAIGNGVPFLVANGLAITINDFISTQIKHININKDETVCKQHCIVSESDKAMGCIQR